MKFMTGIRYRKKPSGENRLAACHQVEGQQLVEQLDRSYHYKLLWPEYVIQGSSQAICMSITPDLEGLYSEVRRLNDNSGCSPLSAD